MILRNWLRVFVATVFAVVCFNPTIGFGQDEPLKELPKSSKQLKRIDVTPEMAVRIFMLAVALKDEEQLKWIALPMDGFDVLLQGKELSTESRENIVSQIKSYKLRRLELNEKVVVPGGGEVTMDSERVNENRVQITFPGNPIPFDVLRGKSGLWWINPEHVIVGRRAAIAARKESSKP